MNPGVLTQQADLFDRIREVDGKLGSLGVVTSPYGGLIKSIR